MKGRAVVFVLLAASFLARAEVGDPQIRTDHPFYPGELACSTFERLFKAESEQYARVTKKVPETDEEKALAAWFWRNTHYAHGEEGARDLWGGRFGKGGDPRNREFWTGMFADGFGLCGTTHSQWTAEMEFLLGHGRARGVGVQGHNSFEVFLKGGAYGQGRWALLDHDISTVIFDSAGTRLLSIPEVKADLKNLVDRNYLPQKQHGWLVCGLAAGDGSVYQRYDVAEYLAGYAGPPPMVHLRRGETLRRYFEPGLDDGQTFVFWGRNYNTGGAPGPERSQTWVNQPEKMHGSKAGTGYHEGQARYGNAVYLYRPDFRTKDYLEGVIEQTGERVTFEFYTPYVIGATPPNKNDWGIYDSGCKNGLVVRGLTNVRVEVSVDQGAHWFSAGSNQEIDLTDFVKGHRQYWLRFWAKPSDLAQKLVEIQTVCQAAVGVLPRLKDDGTTVSFESSAHAIVSAGPNSAQAKPHIVSGAFNTPTVTLEMSTPRSERIAEIYAAAHVASGNPPASDIQYQIEYSADAGKTWKPVVKDWTIPRHGEEPGDFWSQSMCYGSAAVDDGAASKALVRFRNSGGRNYLRAEAHLVYRTRGADATRVSYHWTDSNGEHTESHLVAAGKTADRWELPTAIGVRTRWVEMQNVAP